MNTSAHPPLATARLFGDGLDPDTVRAIVGTQPDRAARKGATMPAPRVPPGRRPVFAKTGTWFIATKGHPLGRRPADHLNWLVNLPRPAMPLIRHAAPDVSLDFSLLVYAPDFRLDEIPAAVIDAILSLGTLEIECPDSGAHWLLTADTWRKVPAATMHDALLHD